jgi:hypothetical protein
MGWGQYLNPQVLTGGPMLLLQAHPREINEIIPLVHSEWCRAHDKTPTRTEMTVTIMMMITCTITIMVLSTVTTINIVHSDSYLTVLS